MGPEDAADVERELGLGRVSVRQTKRSRPALNTVCPIMEQVTHRLSSLQRCSTMAESNREPASFSMARLRNTLVACTQVNDRCDNRH